MLAKHLALVVAALVPSVVQGCSSGTGETYFSFGGGGPADGGSANQANAEAGDIAANGATAAFDGGEAGAAGATSLSAGGAAGAEAALIVPQDLTVMPLEGENGILHMIALTLRQGPSNVELYAALRNDGSIPACDAAVSVELYDKSRQSLAAAVSAALTTHLYRRTDGSGAIASCVSPGDIAMAAITDLPSSIAINDVGYVVYQGPFFALDAIAIDGFALENVKRVATRNGTSYAGSFVNELDVTVSSPSVAVFPVNRVGRPLGVVRANSASELAPGASWNFETTQDETYAATAANERGESNTTDGYFAYPSAALAN